MYNIEKGNFILDFYADWCVPCQQLKPIMEELKEEFANKVNVVPVDTGDEEGRKLAISFKVRGIPAVAFIKDGELLEFVAGIHNKEVYIEKINQLF